MIYITRYDEFDNGLELLYGMVNINLNICV